MALPIEEVLAGGVEIVAKIHHAHGVKAAVSALMLNQRFPNDNVLIEMDEAQHVSEPMLEAAIQKLLIHGLSNLHLLTLSAAIVWLWDKVQPGQRGALLSLAAHYTLDSDA